MPLVNAETDALIRANERNDPVEKAWFAGGGAVLFGLLFLLGGAGFGGTTFGALLGAGLGWLLYRNLYRLKVYAITAGVLVGGVLVLVFLFMHW
jgi:hypothetical protein